MDIQKNKTSRLASFKENPSKALWTLAIPVMAGMAVHTVYTVVDMIFIGRLGGEQIAAVAFNMPLFFLVLGMTMGLGAGVTATVARYIGAERKHSADNAAEHAMVIALIISTVLTGFGFWRGEAMLSFLGAKGPILTYAWQYLKFICVGLPFMIFSGFFRSILSGEGDMKLPMMVAGFGTLLNLILDPIFIFSLDMGVRGAAIATAISQITVFTIFVYMMFVKEHAYVTFRMKDFKWSSDIIKDIIKVGIPASVSMVIMATGGGVFNRILATFSSDAVAGYQVAGRVDMIIFLPIMGIGTGLTTLVGMFYGAKEFDQLRKVVKYGISRAFYITLILSIIIYAFAPIIMSIFTKNENILSVGINYLRLICIVYPLIAVGMNIGRVLQGLGRGLPQLTITITRVLGVSVPLALIFTQLLHKPLEWVWYSMMLSSFVAVTISVIWLKAAFKKQVPI